MQNVKTHNKIKFDPAVGMEHLFSPKTIKIILYLAAILISFPVLYFTAHAGMERYPNLYSMDAKMKNDIEVDANSEIKIVFNQPVIFLEKKNIEITPESEFDFVLSDSGKELILKHEEPFLFETKYEIELKGMRGLSGLLMDNKKIIFFTKSAENEKKLLNLIIMKWFFLSFSYRRINTFLRMFRNLKSTWKSSQNLKRENI